MRVPNAKSNGEACESAPSDTVQLLVYYVAGQMCGLFLSDVERIVRSVAITPLADAPDTLMGIVNLRGRIVPAVNMRKRLQLPERDLAPSDRFIIVRAAKRAVALVVDSTEGIVERKRAEIVPGEEIAPGLDSAGRVFKTREGMILIYDLNGFLFPEEEDALYDALSAK